MHPDPWPGGIPAHVKFHPEPIDSDDVKEEIKGWQLFVKVITSRALVIYLKIWH